MKIVFRLFAFLIILCALAGAGWGGYWLYRRYAPPGGQGRNMEVRLLALVEPAAPGGTSSGVGLPQDNASASPADTGSAPGVTQENPAALPAATGPAIDVFEQQDLSSYIASGDAPAGWKWLPVANEVEREVTASATAGSGNEYVTRTSNGKMYLLVADTPDKSLTHSSGIRTWGVDSVRVVTDEFGPAVDIHLDQAGGELMHQFTQKYLGHRIAVVVGGEICEVATIQSPVRSAIVVRLPAGQKAEAENLRSSLMK
jgi:hypothetical protein